MRMRTTNRRRPAQKVAPSPVTLVVYGWSSVEPGTLAWTFPSLRAAVTAAQKMKNATDWAIVSGSVGAHADGKPVDVDEARAAGEVLMETLPTRWLRIG
jgi:hypothetical protein